MKKPLLLFVVACMLLTSYANAQLAKQKKITLSALQLPRKEEADNDYYIVECILFNQSTDTLKFLEMSCSWTDFYRLDPRTLVIEAPLCSQDTPLIISLAPGEKRKTILKILKDEQLKKPASNTFKIGFNLVETESVVNFESKRNARNFLWSNRLKLM